MLFYGVHVHVTFSALGLDETLRQQTIAKSKGSSLGQKGGLSRLGKGSRCEVGQRKPRKELQFLGLH